MDGSLVEASSPFLIALARAHGMALGCVQGRRSMCNSTGHGLGTGARTGHLNHVQRLLHCDCRWLLTGWRQRSYLCGGCGGSACAPVCSLFTLSSTCGANRDVRRSWPQASNSFATGAYGPFLGCGRTGGTWKRTAHRGGVQQKWCTPLGCGIRHHA